MEIRRVVEEGEEGGRVGRMEKDGEVFRSGMLRGERKVMRMGVVG